MPNISALSNFIREAAKENFAISPLLMSQAENSLYKWIHAKPLLNLSQDAVENVICSGCEERCYMPVEPIRKHDGQLAYYVACDKRDDIGLVKLAEYEIQQYLFDITALCRMLANLLGSIDDTSQCIPNILYRLGRCNIDGYSFTAFLAFDLENTRIIQQHPDFMNAINPLVISVAKDANQTTYPVIILDELIYFGNDDLKLFPASLAKFSNAAPVAANANIFKDDCDYWQISFNGKSTKIKNIKGCHYIHHLLQNPGKAFHVTDLQKLINKAEIANEDYADMSTEQLEEEGVAVETNEADNNLDAASIKSFKAQIKNLEKQISEAENAGMTEKAATLRKNQSDIKAFLKKNTDNKGKSRKAATSNSRARLAVKRRIDDLYDKLGKTIPEAVIYLKKNIKTGSYCTYIPAQEMCWILK